MVITCKMKVLIQNKFLIFCVFFAVQLIFLCNAESSSSANTPSKTNRIKSYIEGEVIVKYKNFITKADLNKRHSLIAAKKIKDIGNLRLQHIKLPDNIKTEDAVKYYRTLPEVEYAEPNFIVKKASTIPNDAGYDLQWGLKNIKADLAWDVTTGSNRVIIAIIDSGISFEHPDLKENIWSNSKELCNDGIDNDNNGYIDDCYGWDYIDNDGFPEDFDGHGTMVAGVIGATSNNSIGIAGVMWNVKIMPLRILGINGGGDIANAIRAINYAVENGAKVINTSWGNYDYSQALYDSINYASSKGVLFVAAAGNDGSNNDTEPFYPASYNLDNIISVTAIDNNDNLESYFNYGKDTVHLAAPGVSIQSTFPNVSFGPDELVYETNFEGTLTSLSWGKGGTNSSWDIVNGTLEDSPNTNYLPNTLSWTGYLEPIVVEKNCKYKLSFQWKGYIERDSRTLECIDYLNINYSLDKKNWDYVDWRCGQRPAFFNDVSYELTSVADIYNSFYFGFGFESDATKEYDGVYIDNIKLYKQKAKVNSYIYKYEDGTSFSAPFVTGVAGLIYSFNPTLTYKTVKKIIIDTVDVRENLNGKVISNGKLNAYNAIKYVYENYILSPTDLKATLITDNKIYLTWTDNSINEDGFIIEKMDGISSNFNEVFRVVKNTTFFYDSNIKDGFTYTYRIKAFREGEIYSDYSNETNINIPKNDLTIKNDRRCFIATAVYGSPFSKEVSILRDFRDKYLMTNKLGRCFVKFYYEFSPHIAQLIEKNYYFKLIVRILLTQIVLLIEYFSQLLIFFSIFVSSTFLIICFTKNKKRQF